MTSSLTFSTDLDRTVPPLPLPTTVRNGGDRSLSIADGFVRGTRIVGRFSADPGLIGLKVAAAGRPLRVTVEIRADAETASWWQHRVPDRVKPRNPHGPRLLLVRSQGVTRTAVLLARRPGAFALDARATAQFDLPAEDVPDDGLLIIEFADAGAALGLGDLLPQRGAVGVRINSITVQERPLAGRPPSRSGQPAMVWTRLTKGAGPVTTKPVRMPVAVTASTGAPTRALPPAGFFLVTPAHPVAGRFTWTLHSRPSGMVRPDEILPQRVPLWQQPPTGSPPLRYRDKGIAVARYRLRLARHAAARRFRRSIVRTGRLLSAPVRYVVHPVNALAAARLSTPRAELVPLDGGPARPCVVVPRGAGTIAVRYTGRIDGPAVVRLIGGARSGWHLGATRHDPPTEATPNIGTDPLTNRAEIQRLLDLDDPVTVRLPGGRIEVTGGLALRENRTLLGAATGGTVLVQTESSAAPLLHVLGSGVRVEDLTLALPSVQPGPHDGDRWTAITIGRYFYAAPPEWISRIMVRRVRVERAGRCSANSVALLGAVRDVTLTDLSISGGGTAVGVHWGAVGSGVRDLTGPSYHPNDLRITGLRVRDAFEAFYLSSVHDVTVRDVRCSGVEVGFRLLPGDNTDRFHRTPGTSPVSTRIAVSEVEVGWCGQYGLRLAGWGRSEVDKQVSELAYRDVTVDGCLLRAEPPRLGSARRRRVAVALEHADGIVLRDIAFAEQSAAATPDFVEASRDDEELTLADLVESGAQPEDETG
ncbi:MAG: hypothetical protein WCA46_03555 [Actinocatenispora sp.]